MSAAPQEKNRLRGWSFITCEEGPAIWRKLRSDPDRIFLLETEPTFTTCLIFTKIGVLYYSRQLPSEVLLIIDLHAKLNSVIVYNNNNNNNNNYYYYYYY